MLTFVTGYSGSGKTTLPKLYNKLLPFNYAIYRSPLYQASPYLTVRPAGEVRITTELRKSFKFRYNYLTDITNDELYEHHKKHKPDFIQHLEKYTEEMRRFEPLFFIRSCYNKFMVGNEGENLIVTDFRFENEFEFLCDRGRRPTTVRIFKTEAKESNRESDHALDKFKTDFLFVPLERKEEHFQNACKQFHHYSNYQEYKKTHYYF